MMRVYSPVLAKSESCTKPFISRSFFKLSHYPISASTRFLDLQKHMKSTQLKTCTTTHNNLPYHAAKSIV